MSGSQLFPAFPIFSQFLPTPTMLIRPLRTEDCKEACTLEHLHGPSDLPALHELYVEQGFEYSEPDWLKTIGSVLADENDVPLIALMGRPTVEMYALVKKGLWATPGIKAEYFKRLDLAVIQQLRAKGYEDQHSWIPPQCRAFVRRLMKELGWVRTDGKDAFVGLMRWIG